MKKSLFIQIFTGILLIFSASVFSFAKGDYIFLRSKNFQFAGEVSEAEIRREALKLERFREIFRRAFPEINIDAPAAQPTILVFKNSESFAPFKPVRENGLADGNVSGFFQSSDEANYIAFPVANDAGRSGGTIYHEYVHFLISNNFQTSDLPVWLNEGLAEYYQTFEMKNERTAIFGKAEKSQLHYLREYRLSRLKSLTAIDYPSLTQMPVEQKNLFYAQSWALVHFLIGKSGDSLNALVKKYLAAAMKNERPEAVFESAFGLTFSEAETELENYISKSFFKTNSFDSGEKVIFETRTETESLGEAAWLRYLGDLLFQARRYDAAAEILKKSLALDEKSAAANLLLGKIFLKQGNHSQAVSYFEKTIALDGEDYAANFYLADVLFRKNLSPDGYVNRIPDEQAKKIRELLKSVIRRNPKLIEAYKMLASISIVNDDEFSESIEYARKALEIQPQNFRLEYNLAQLLLRKKDFANARRIAAGLSEKCAVKDFCERVSSFISALNSIEEKEKEIAELRKKYGLENVDFETENQLPPEEAMNRALNRSLRKPQPGEKRFVGYLSEITCGKNITFNLEGENRFIKLSKPSFDGISLISFSRNTAGVLIECGKPKVEMFVVATYKDEANAKSGGELLVLEFVPKEFKFPTVTEN